MMTIRMMASYSFMSGIPFLVSSMMAQKTRFRRETWLQDLMEEEGEWRRGGGKLVAGTLAMTKLSFVMVIMNTGELCIIP